MFEIFGHVDFRIFFLRIIIQKYILFILIEDIDFEARKIFGLVLPKSVWSMGESGVRMFRILQLAGSNPNWSALGLILGEQGKCLKSLDIFRFSGLIFDL